MKNSDKDIKGIGYAYTLLFYRDKALLGFPDMALVDRIRACAEEKNLSFSSAVKFMCIKYLLGESHEGDSAGREPNPETDNTEPLVDVQTVIRPEDREV